MNKKTAIYGWAFNPPTLWHKYVIKEVLEQSSTIEKIIIHRKWYDFDKQKVKNYEFIPGQPLSISSTMVREGIKITKKVEHLLIPEVAEYIERRKLYK